MSNEKLDEAGVLAKFGVPPERIVDYLALIGDTAVSYTHLDVYKRQERYRRGSPSAAAAHPAAPSHQKGFARPPGWQQRSAAKR